MNKIVFNLKGTDLDNESFEFLVSGLLKNNVMVNGYTLCWNYDVIGENCVVLSALLKKLK